LIVFLSEQSKYLLLEKIVNQLGVVSHSDLSTSNPSGSARILRLAEISVTVKGLSSRLKGT
jgi:hypothetical protein